MMDSLPEDAGAGPLAVLPRFRLDFHTCLTARADELSELADGGFRDDILPSWSMNSSSTLPLTLVRIRHS
jgi:hypothetical protein